MINLGASFYTTAHHEIMENYVGKYRKVYLANEEPMDIVGIDGISLRMVNGSIWKILKWSICLLMHNLASFGPLDGEGHNVTFDAGSWNVTKGAMVVARENKYRTLHITSNCRNMTEKGIKVLQSKGKLSRLKSIEHNLCKCYIFDKQKMVNFSKIWREPKATKLEFQPRRSTGTAGLRHRYFLVLHYILLTNRCEP